jgi:hypothetical protein
MSPTAQEADHARSVLMTRSRNVLVFLLAAMVALLGRAVVSAATATDLPEKVVTDISTLAGIWKGTVAGGAAMELTINPDGTWTNVLTGGGTFTGRAMVAGSKVRARSDTTGRAYFWRLLERGGRRVLIFLNDPDETVAATVEFDSRSARGTAPTGAPVVAPKSAPRTSEVAITGCVSQTVIRVPGPESVSIPGVLYCPERGGAAPGVVLLPPTGGVGKHVLDWGEWLASEGYVALVLDSDAARRTVTPCRTRMHDAFAAATQLRALGLADADRIAMLGFSIGGSAALEAAGESAAAGGAGYRFRAAIAVYPPARLFGRTRQSPYCSC